MSFSCPLTNKEGVEQEVRFRFVNVEAVPSSVTFQSTLRTLISEGEGVVGAAMGVVDVVDDSGRGVAAGMSDG